MDQYIHLQLCAGGDSEKGRGGGNGYAMYTGRSLRRYYTIWTDRLSSPVSTLYTASKQISRRNVRKSRGPGHHPSTELYLAVPSGSGLRIYIITRFTTPQWTLPPKQPPKHRT
jgi:hypothetical protein